MPESIKKTCGTRACGKGPGYKSPMDAFNNGPAEKLLYTTCIMPRGANEADWKPDYLATVDVDPASPTYSQVVSRLQMPDTADELHHTGWNSCSSCYDDPECSRKYLSMPTLLSNRIYLADIYTNPRKPTLHKVIKSEEIQAKLNISALHTSHCLASGEVMISGLGDVNGNAKGEFLIVDGETFEPKGSWIKEGEAAPFGYDFWYQPAFNTMISTEWGAPNAFMKGFNPADVAKGLYGHHLNIWDWEARKLKQRLDLGPNGQLPLEVRFLHNPNENQGYVGCALSSTIFHFYELEDGTYTADEVISIPSKTVDGWILPEMPALITDILLSLDDKYLYISCWLFGEIRQYDITDRKHPKFVGIVQMSGCLCEDVVITNDPEVDHPLMTDFTSPRQLLQVDGKTYYGAPQMLQLSLDGKRLYCTSSLISVWDVQFFPKMFEQGSFMARVDVDTENGGMTRNPSFLVDFTSEPDGPSLCHEMRYPGGDCTSDIWLVETDHD